jgi:hypothetical protein
MRHTFTVPFVSGPANEYFPPVHARGRGRVCGRGTGTVRGRQWDSSQDFSTPENTLESPAGWVPPEIRPLQKTPPLLRKHALPRHDASVGMGRTNHDEYQEGLTFSPNSELGHHPRR